MCVCTILLIGDESPRRGNCCAERRSDPCHGPQHRWEVPGEVTEEVRGVAEVTEEVRGVAEESLD